MAARWPPAADDPRARVIFEIASDDKLRNKPDKASKFELASPRIVTLIQTTHWNGGRGAPPGSISLRCRDGRLHGPWAATALPHGGTASVLWQVRPGVRLPAGVCAVIDSDPLTWSYADDTQRRGLVRIEGYPPDTGE
jgi:hypothetical protein